MKLKLFVAVLTLAGLAFAQTTPQVPYVQASGDATLNVQPDQAMINIGVVTQASTAQAAASQNASQVQAVLSALTPVVGTSGTIKTISYSVTPNYSYPQNASPVLTGYTVTNVVQVTTSDLNSVGRIIDTATQAGANSIQSLQFGLKDDTVVQQQALRQAAGVAKSQADAIAGGLGLRTTSVISAEQASAMTVIPLTRLSAGGAAASTPVQPGTVQVQATVIVRMAVTP